MRVFISGPMTGYAGFNRAAFNDAERTLASQGHVVLNPAVLTDGLTQAQYMDICAAMVRCADAIFMLQGWEASAGARAECALAEKLGHRILYQAPPSDNAGLTSDDPLGAIENGRAFADRLEKYQFECDGGKLNMYSDWQEFRRCFEYLSEWVIHSQIDKHADPRCVIPLNRVPDKLPREYIRGWPLGHSDYAQGWNDCREAVLRSIDPFREGGNQ